MPRQQRTSKSVFITTLLLNPLLSMACFSVLLDLIEYALMNIWLPMSTFQGSESMSPHLVRLQFFIAASIHCTVLTTCFRTHLHLRCTMKCLWGLKYTLDLFSRWLTRILRWLSPLDTNWDESSPHCKVQAEELVDGVENSANLLVDD